MALKDSKREQIIADLQPALLDGETLIDVTTGRAEVTRMGDQVIRRGTVFVTDRRIGLFTDHGAFVVILDFSYGLLTSLEYKKGISFGEISLLAAGGRARFHKIPKDLVEEFVKVIRERLAVSHHHNQPPAQVAPPSSVADELTKLASLRDAGVLTQEEFDAQKAKIIG